MIREAICTSVYFGAFLSLFAFYMGSLIQKRWKFGVFNPLLLSIVFVIVILLVFHVDYDAYYTGAKYISYLLTPATVCLAVPLYEQLSALKKNVKAIFLGILAGVFSSLGSILAFSYMFGFSHTEYVTLLPKSITTAIGIGVAEELGGMPAVTVAVIILTGIFGNVIAGAVCGWFSIRHPVAKGLALGTSAHVIGTAKAFEMGETEGAMSSLAVAVAGLITVAAAGIFAGFY